MLNDCLHALAHAHARDLIHRDIKPANVLIRQGTLGAQYVLTDFGIAHAAERQTRTFGSDQTASSHEDASGTPHYMSPEQFTGLWRDYGPWTDLYALGIVAWELMTGTPPFRGSNVVMVGLML
ncbi:MAG: protein kinase [bacterium]